MEIKKQVKYINEHGETMDVCICKDDKFWFKHTDCNDEFELITAPFKYILDETEKLILKNFLKSYIKYEINLLKDEL